MENPFWRYLSSPLLTFYVGSNKEEVTVYFFAFTDLSEPLNAHVSRHIYSNTPQNLDWSHVDEHTFARLCQFAYFRDYTPPKFRLIDGMSPPVKVTESREERLERKKRKKPRSSIHRTNTSTEPAPEPEPEPEIDQAEPDAPPTEDAFDNQELPCIERSVCTEKLRKAFERSLVVPSPPTTGLNHTFTPPENVAIWEDFTPVLLEQAELYVLANKWGIDSLCDLVLSKLYQTLKSFKLYETSLNSICELILFVYGIPQDEGIQLDGIRNLVTRYVVSVYGQIGGNQCFQEILAQGGPFLKDFLNVMWGFNEDATT